MKLKERLTLLRAGYTRAEIDDMIQAEQTEAETETATDTETDTVNEDLAAAMAENEKLKNQISEMQKQNISKSENEKPKEQTSSDVWSSFFGETK